MSTSKTQEKWDEKQIKYAAYLARGKRDRFGNKRTEEQFAAAQGVNASTLWRWKQLDGFMQLVFDMTMKGLIDDLPEMVKAVAAKATGRDVTYTDAKGKRKTLKAADTQAFMAIMRQAGLLKSDKIDHTTAGKALPTPVMDLPALRTNPQVPPPHFEADDD